MATRSRFFDSSAGDRVYTSDAWAQVVAGLVGTGVVPTGNQLAVAEDSPAAMSVQVATGIAYVLGYYFEVYSAVSVLSLAAADATNPRIDRIVVRRSLANREVTLAVLTGTPAASPAAPALTQNTAGTYEISLAQVYVAALATSVTNANITDERGSRAAGPDVTAALDATTGHAHTGAAGDAPAIAYSNVTGKPSTFAPSAHTHADGSTGGTVAYSVITGKPSTFAPSSHTHADAGTGGTISYNDLTSKPSSFTPAAHALDPASGYHTGSLPWGSVSGKPSTFAPSAHASSHGSAGSDPISIAYSQITSGVPSTFAPSAHASNHASGGSDPVSPASIGAPLWASAGGGASGVRIWVGTTTPSASTSEGDIWAKG